MPIPDNQLIYHIIHLDRLASIISDGRLLSDFEMRQREGSYGTNIGIQKIKDTRLAKNVGSRSRGTVGQYVPFYFCPRSVMLYKIYKRESPDLDYHDGQTDVIHLVARLDKVLEWADANARYWAATASNAAAAYAEFFYTRPDLEKLHWDDIPKRDWRQPEIKEAKQSEFLVMNNFPWELIIGVGVCNDSMKLKVERVLSSQASSPLVKVKPEWYYGT